MNVQAAIQRPAPVKLKVEDFLLLKGSGAFAGFRKLELLGGELFGVPLHGKDEPETDTVEGIRLRVRDYLMLDRAGAFRACPKTELLEGVVYEVSPQFLPHIAKDELAYVALLVEVADNGRRMDLGEKACLYARHGIPEYWVVYLERNLIHQMSAPEGEAYAERREVPFGVVLEAKTIAGLKVDTGDLA